MIQYIGRFLTSGGTCSWCETVSLSKVRKVLEDRDSHKLKLTCTCQNGVFTYHILLRTPTRNCTGNPNEGELANLQEKLTLGSEIFDLGSIYLMYSFTRIVSVFLLLLSQALRLQICHTNGPFINGSVAEAMKHRAGGARCEFSLSLPVRFSLSPSMVEFPSIVGFPMRIS